MHRKKTREDLLNPKEKSIMAEWYRMRSQTKAMAFIQKTIFSFEYASVAISALFYYQKTIQPKDPVLFYSITMGVIYLTASCSAVYGGRFVDRTGRLRVFSIFVSIFSIVGNIIYSVPYSKWFPILGRSLSGISDGVQPGIAGKSICAQKFLYIRLDSSNMLKLHDTDDLNIEKLIDKKTLLDFLSNFV